jgi:heme-degrading monooxygenase HmoA
MHPPTTADFPKSADATLTSSSQPHSAAASSLSLQCEFPRDERDLQNYLRQTSSTGYVALSRFTVAHMTDAVKQAFQQRPHRVDNAAGFVRMEVLSPCDAPDEIWLITYWKDEPSYRTWHHSHRYKESHQGIPKGLRLVPKSVSIRFFEHVAS